MIHIKTVFQRIVADIRLNFIALLIILFYMILAQCFFHTVCPFKIVTGLSCPGCGLTRAAVYFFMGKFQDALRMNPAIYVWLPFLGYLCFFRYFLGKKPPFVVFLVIFVCLATFGIFAIGLGQDFSF